MIEKAGSRVELSTWPTTLVVEADATQGQAAALVDQTSGRVTPLTRDGSRWTVDIEDVADTTDLVVYRADSGQGDTGPDVWKVTVGGSSFEVEWINRSHFAVILVTLYRRETRRMAKIDGNGYAFGIEGYARRMGIDIARFPVLPSSPPRAAMPPSARSPARPSEAPHAGGHLRGQGSGVCVGEGLVITNHHVVADVDRLVVVHEGRRSEAQVLMTDVEHDIAIVRHELSGLHSVLPRDGAEGHLGEEILAAGFPLAQVLGYDLKLTYGNVSGMRGGENIAMLQFTAAIASGSSGGALLDMSGRLVGIVSAALRHGVYQAHGATSENVNFAVKASLVRELLVAAGRDVAPYAQEQPIGRADLARLARGCIVSVDCYRG